ncbi:MAG: hypothetical protein DMF85_02520 [Acidobacteria bacterium]|nr:MAG: hypothetical protein DMF85_02520 [Acidobacteriota bacterium]
MTSGRKNRAGSRIPRSGSRAPRIVVVGGAGAMGRIAIRDLVETAPAGVEIVLADRDARVAREVARPFGGRVRVIDADARNVRRTARALDGASVVINACHHTLNLDVMHAALAARCHYVDLGGLFHVTREQLRLHATFRRATLTAVGSRDPRRGRDDRSRAAARAVADRDVVFTRYRARRSVGAGRGVHGRAVPVRRGAQRGRARAVSRTGRPPVSGVHAALGGRDAAAELQAARRT